MTGDVPDVEVGGLGFEHAGEVGPAEFGQVGRQRGQLADDLIGDRGRLAGPGEVPGAEVAERGAAGDPVPGAGAVGFAEDPGYGLHEVRAVVFHRGFAGRVVHRFADPAFVAAADLAEWFVRCRRADVPHFAAVLVGAAVQQGRRGGPVERAGRGANGVGQLDFDVR